MQKRRFSALFRFQMRDTRRRRRMRPGRRRDSMLPFAVALGLNIGWARNLKRDVTWHKANTERRAWNKLQSEEIWAKWDGCILVAVAAMLLSLSCCRCCLVTHVLPSGLLFGKGRVVVRVAPIKLSYKGRQLKGQRFSIRAISSVSTFRIALKEGRGIRGVSLATVRSTT